MYILDHARSGIGLYFLMPLAQGCHKTIGKQHHRVCQWNDSCCCQSQLPVEEQERHQSNDGHRQPAKELTDKVSGKHFHIVVVADNVCPDVAGITTVEETHRQAAQVIDHSQTAVTTYFVTVVIGYEVGFLGN